MSKRNGWAYGASALMVIWYVIKGSDDAIYLFWALAFFIHATALQVMREVREWGSK